ncbi:MAG: biotin synthase BioB [Eubacterium sp.]|nr:biotin synthase BioB [Eubacterium sp.]
MNIKNLTTEIINGRRLTTEDDTDFLKAVPLDELSVEADRLRAHFSGNAVDLCSIISGKSGKCTEDCKYCAQSAFNHTGCDVYDLLDYDTIYEKALSDMNEGVKRFAIVNSGWGPTDEEFDKLIDIYTRLNKELSISLCASLGFLSTEQFKRLYDAGVRRYHNNIETSRRFFPEICTTHLFEDKLENIRRAQSVGLTVCSGGIIGMGETMDDRIDMAFTLSSLGIKSIPINTLIPIPNTPLEKLPLLTEEEILRTVAIFRFINPEADIRLAAGRRLISGNGEAAYKSGASAAITGNMLTTTGSTIKNDIELLTKLKRLA